MILINEMALALSAILFYGAGAIKEGTKMHTKLFGCFTALFAMPSVTYMALLAIDPDQRMISFGVGVLFTWSAVVCVGLMIVTAASALCDLAD